MKLTLITCSLIITMQTIFIIVPVHFINIYHTLVRPFTFVLITILIYILKGKPKFKTSKNALAAAALSVIIFGIFMLILLFSQGAALNAFTANIRVALHSILVIGTSIILGDIIRFNLIRASSKEERELVFNLITIVLVYSQMFDIHMILNGNIDLLLIFFGYIFAPLVISYVASYFSIKGSLSSVILFNFVFLMTPYLSPVLPNIAPVVFSIIVSGLAFISAMCYYFLNDKLSSNQKIRIKRKSRYSKKRLREYTLFIVIIGIAASFFLGVFAIYPLAIRTNSMAGTFYRGSLVFVERVPLSRVFDMVGEGYVIHYQSPLNPNTTFTHRVVEFRTDINGERLFITRGDAAYEHTYTIVRKSEVIGIVRAFLPYIGLPPVLIEEMFLRLN